MAGITVNSSMDTKGVVRGAEEIQHAIDSLKSAINRVNNSIASSANLYLKAFSTASDAAKDTSSAFGATGDTVHGMRDEFSAAIKMMSEYINLTKQAASLRSQMAVYEESGVGNEVEEYRQLQDALNSTVSLIQELNSESQQLFNVPIQQFGNYSPDFENDVKALQEYQELLLKTNVPVDMWTEWNDQFNGFLDKYSRIKKIMEDMYRIPRETVQKAETDTTKEKVREEVNPPVRLNSKEFESQANTIEKATKKLSNELEKIDSQMQKALAGNDTKAVERLQYEFANATKEANGLKQAMEELSKVQIQSDEYAELVSKINAAKQELQKQTQYYYEEEAKQQKLRDKAINEAKESFLSWGGLPFGSDSGREWTIDDEIKQVIEDFEETDGWKNYVWMKQYIEEAKEELQKMVALKEQLEGKEGTFQNGEDAEGYQRLLHYMDIVIEKKDEIEKPQHVRTWEGMTTASDILKQKFAEVAQAIQIIGYSFQHPLQALDRFIPVAAAGVANLAKTIASNAVSALRQMASAALNAATGLARMVGSAVVSFVNRLATAAHNAAVQLAKMIGTGVANGLKTIASLAQRAGKALLGMGKSAKSSNTSLKQSLTMILRYTLGIRSMYMLVRRLRSAVTDAFKNMAKKIPEVNQSLSMLASSLDRLKNSLGTAFQPILTAIAPYLSQLMDMLSDALTKVGMFFAALTGQQYVYKATKANIDYAKSLDKSSKSSKKAAKEAENQLAAFDHLNILQDNKNDDNDNDKYETPTSDFEKVPVDSKIADFVKKLMDAFRNGELYKIGKQFADLVNNFVKNTVKWEKIGKKLGKIINGVVDLFNGFMDNVQWEEIGKGIGKAVDGLLDTVNWKNLGKAFSQKINAIFGILWGLVQDTARWKKLGKALAELVEGYFGNIKWDLIGKTIGTAINGIATAIYEFAENFPWDEMGEKLASGIRSLVETIDIEEIYKAFSALLKGILDLIYPILSDTATWNKIASDFRTFLENFFKDDTLWNKASAALRAGLRSAISSLNIIFGDGTLLGELGTRLAKFLNDLMGDKELWDGIGTLVNNMMKGILSFGDKFLTEFDPKVAADNIKLALGKIEWENIANETWALIKKFFSKAGNFVDALFSESTEGLSGEALRQANAFNAKPLGARMAEKIKGVFSLDLWKDIAKTVWGTAKQAFTVAGDFISTMLGIDTAEMNAEERLKAIGNEVGTKLGELGATIGEKLANLPWGTIFSTAFGIIAETLKGLIAGLLGDESGNGKVLLWIVGGIAALKLGIVPMIAKLIAGLGAALLSGGPVLAAGLTAALAVAAAAGIKKLAELTVEIVQAQKDLNAALEGELDTGTYNYVYLWKTCGEDAANEFARSVAGIELTGKNMEENLEQLGRKIAADQGRTFDDVQTTVANAMGTYKSIVVTDSEEAAKEWALNALQIELTGNDTAENLQQLADTIEQYAGNSKDTTTQIVKDACNSIDIDVSGMATKVEATVDTSTDNIESSVSTSLDNVESTTGTKGAEIESNLVEPYENALPDVETLTSQMQQTVNDATGNMYADVQSNMNEASRAYDEGISAIKTSAETGWKGTEDTTKLHLDEMKKNVDATSSDISSTTTEETANQEKEWIDKYYSIAYIVDVSMSDAANYMKRHTDTMMETIRNGMNNMVEGTRQGLSNMLQTMFSVDFQPVGSNIIQGIANGINGGWNWLNQTVYNLAWSLYRSACAALGIASPSKLFRDEIGFMVGAGLAEGLDDSQHTVLDSISDMSTAMADEMNGTNLMANISANDDGLLEGLDGVLTSFGNNVENSFVTLTQRLQAIADSVTFRTPEIAAGTVLPYAIQGQPDVNTDDVSIAFDEDIEELISVIIQAFNNQTSAIVQALERNGNSSSGMDLRSTTDSIIDEINRRARAMGKTPLLI